jgi:hypothetical protein
LHRESPRLHATPAGPRPGSLPVAVAVHDDLAEARSVAADLFAVYADLPDYQRILAHGESTALLKRPSSETKTQ